MNVAGIGIVANDIDLLAAQVIGDVGDAARFRPEASADRIDFRAIAPHGYLRTASWIARNRHDLDRTVGNFGNFQLEQTLDQPLGRSRENHLRAFGRLLDVEHVGANEIVDAISFAGNLLVEIHHRFVAPFERDVHVALLVTLHGSRNQVVELTHVLVVNRVSLGLANALHDDLLGSLRRDASEILGRNLFVEEVPDLIRPPARL